MAANMTRLLGHFKELARFTDLCSIDMEDAILIAKDLEGARDAGEDIAVALDAWWKDMVAYLAGLLVIYNDGRTEGADVGPTIARIQEAIDAAPGQQKELAAGLRDCFATAGANFQPDLESTLSDLCEAAVLKLEMLAAQE
jgi:hypothetical protein